VTLLVGVQAYRARGDAARRQACALAALAGLARVARVNLQWPDEVLEVDGFETLSVLRRDSIGATGRRGARKPLVREMFDALCAAAEARGARLFCFANSDIHIPQPLVDRVLAEPRDGWAVSRMDYDGETGRDLEVVTRGVDAFVVSTAWWRRHRRRFRAYVAGEPVWDNVYAALLCGHGDAVVLNRGAGLVRHERHPPAWGASPYAGYTHLLAALDAPAFSRWARYHHALEALRARGAGEAEEWALQHALFRARPSPGERVVQVGRALRARLRWAARRREKDG